MAALARQARQGSARRGAAWQSRQARRGVARLGEAGQSRQARLGLARRGVAIKAGKAWLGAAWRGNQGRLGAAWHGVAWRGKARQARLGMAWHGTARQSRQAIQIEKPPPGSILGGGQATASDGRPFGQREVTTSELDGSNCCSARRIRRYLKSKSPTSLQGSGSIATDTEP